jgi:hypothetical protein
MKYVIAALVILIVIVVLLMRRRYLRERGPKDSDLDKHFPRRGSSLILIAILLCGCTGRESLQQALDPPTSSNPGASPGSGAGANPGSGAPGDPQVIEAEGCTNTQPAPAQYQPFSCQLRQPVPAGDSVKVIYWTNSDNTLSINTVQVSDPSGTAYLPVVSVPRTGSTNDVIWIASGVLATASPSLVVTVNPGNVSTSTTITIRAVVVVHTSGGNNFKTVISNGCMAPSTPTPGPCLPIQGPTLAPAPNDLAFVVALSNAPIFNAQTLSAPWVFAWASSDEGNGQGYFVVGTYIASSPASVQAALAISQSLLNTNFGWTWSVLEASFN